LGGSRGGGSAEAAAEAATEAVEVAVEEGGGDTPGVTGMFFWGLSRPVTPKWRWSVTLSLIFFGS
jgi:hypothetical protein